MCWATTIGQGKSAGSGVSRASSAGGPPVEVPTSTRPSPDAPGASRLAAARGAARRIAAASRADAMPHAFLQPRRSTLILARRRRAHLGDQLRRAARRCRSETAPSGLATKSTAPSRSASKRRVRALRRERRHHDHRTGPFDHDAVEAGQAVHLRHVDVERDDVGRGRLRASSSASRPLRANRTSKSASVAKTCPSSFRMRAEVVDDQDLGHTRARPVSASNASSRPALGARQQFGGVEQQHDAAGFLEVDHAVHEAHGLVGEVRAPARCRRRNTAALPTPRRR